LGDRLPLRLILFIVHHFGPDGSDDHTHLGLHVAPETLHRRYRELEARRTNLRHGSLLFLQSHEASCQSVLDQQRLLMAANVFQRLSGFECGKIEGM
jgi:hypothetical protein